MSLVLLSGPAVEPITLAEAKAHLRVDGTAEDVLIGSLILTSRLHIEQALGLALVSQGWRLTLDRWPDGPVLELPLGPVIAITMVRTRDQSGAATTMPADDTLLDGRANPPRLIRRSGAWPRPGQPHGGIEIEMTAGYGASAADVPAPIRQALKLLVAHWYEHRDPIEIGSAGVAIPPPVSELVAPYRRVQL